MSAAVKRNRARVFLILTLFAIAVAISFLWPKPDVVYQGKPISEWLKHLETDSLRAKSEAVEVLMRADATVAPALLEGLHRRESGLYRAAWARLPKFVQRRLTPPADYALLNHRCALVLGYIEPASVETVRGLRWALATDDETLTVFAAQALRMIAERESGESAELRKTLPDLRRVLGTSKEPNHAEQVTRAVASIERLGNF